MHNSPSINQPNQQDKFKQFCIDTYQIILSDKFENKNRWINISPTLHALLAHAWELIAANEDKGLGAYTESGLEHNNKFLRFYRQFLSRKNNHYSNLSDCLTRLWLQSDPGIRAAAPLVRCSRCAQANFTVSCPLKRHASQWVLTHDDSIFEDSLN